MVAALSYGSHRAVTWLTSCCHMAHIVLSHGLHRAVTWLTSCCHMAYIALSHGSHCAVTWLTPRCHMAHIALSHGSHRAVTWLTLPRHMAHTVLSHGCHVPACRAPTTCSTGWTSDGTQATPPYACQASMAAGQWVGLLPACPSGPSGCC
jgi:hypothetical protein